MIMKRKWILDSGMDQTPMKYELKKTDGSGSNIPGYCPPMQHSLCMNGKKMTRAKVSPKKE